MSFVNLRRWSGSISLLLLVGLVALLSITLSIIKTTRKQVASNPQIKSPINIVYFTRLFGGKDSRVVRAREYLSKCTEFNCHVTDKRSHIEEADAVVFHFTDFLINTSDIPSIRYPHQHYILFNHEPPPSFSKRDWTAFGNFFNWTQTYRLDSELHFPYWAMRPKTIEKLDRTSIPRFQTAKQLRRKHFRRPFKKQNTVITNDNLNIQVNTSRRAMVAWVVSNCRTQSRREEYVNELSKHIPVDIYGKCGKAIRCSSHDIHICHRDLLTRYKFYLSFESSLCEDYVTEKVWKVLVMGFNRTVPVVLANANLQRLLPLGSYIDVRDFPTPKDLADYLKLLIVSEDDFNNYFTWREEYVPLSASLTSNCNLCINAVCQICAKVAENRRRPDLLARKSYDGTKLTEIFSVERACLKPEGFYKFKF